MIVALTGQRKSGKSLIAKMLMDLHPPFQKIAFADAMKKRLAEKLDISLDDLYAPLGKEKYRRWMQVYCDEIEKNNPTMWVDIVIKHIDDNPGDYIVDDLRYMKELGPLMQRKAVIIQVIADKKSRIGRGAEADSEIDAHISENDVATLPSDVIASLGGEILYNNHPRKERNPRLQAWEADKEYDDAKVEAEAKLKREVNFVFKRFQNRLSVKPVLAD